MEESGQAGGGDAVGALRPQVYRDPRPPESMRKAHEWARTRPPGWTYLAMRILLTPPALILYRCRARGAANVPAVGPVIVAPNHFSNFDHFFARGRTCAREIRFMTKSQLFAANPAVDYLFRVSGHFPVRRGHDDDEAFITAGVDPRARWLRRHLRGGRALAHRAASASRAAAVGRLALESGAPVIPVAIHGSREVRAWRRGRFPKVTVSYGEPISFEPVESALARAPTGGRRADLRPGAGDVRRARLVRVTGHV